MTNGEGKISREGGGMDGHKNWPRTEINGGDDLLAIDGP